MRIAYWVVFLGIASCVNRSVVSVEETAEASLSEIAEHVVAIPLETNERCRMGPVDAVKRAGSEFFMLSNRMLYRFDRTGRFLSRIASDRDGRCSAIRDFAVDPQCRQVVAIDTCGHALFFTYDGTLVRRKALAEKPWQSLLKIAYHDGRRAMRYLGIGRGEEDREMALPARCVVRRGERNTFVRRRFKTFSPEQSF